MSSLNLYQRRSKMKLSDNQVLPSTPAKSTPSSHICNESLIILTPLGRDNEIATKRVSFADSIPDQVSTTMYNVASFSQSCDVNDKFAELMPSFGISTPAKPIPLRPNSHTSAESSIFAPPQEVDFEIVTGRTDMAETIYEQESTTTGIETGSLTQCCDLNDKFAELLPSCSISTPGRRVTMVVNSHVSAELSIFAPPLEGGDVETVTERTDMVDLIYDQESTTSRIETGDDLDAIHTESTPIFFGISTPASKAKIRKVNGKNCVETPKKKKKVYWPKVKGQIKWKSTPKMSSESKTKRKNVSMESDGKGKHKRTTKSKESGSEVNECETSLDVDKHEIQDEFLFTSKEYIISEKTCLHSKGKSSKRSLKFELEENFEDGLDELGFKDDSLPILRKKLPQKKINLSCTLLVRIRRMKLNFPKPKRNRSESQKKSIQELELPLQNIRKRKRSYNCSRNINLCSLTSQGLEHEFGWRMKRKRTTKGKRREKEDSSNFPIDIIPRQEFENWEIREGSKALHTMSNFEEYPLDEDDEGENDVTNERKRKIRKTNVKKISSKEVQVLIKKFQSLNIKEEAPYKNQDRRLVACKRMKEGRQIKVKVNNTELVSYKNQDGELVSYKGMKEGQRIKVKVNFDSETLKEWNLLMHGKSYDENENNKEYWKQERSIYSGRVDAFIARMHNFLGNRSFSRWKGSVLDSVIGVFLTQNVSDHLSSSAYMSLASTFPIKTSSEETKDNPPLLKLEHSSQASTTNNCLNLGNKKLYSPGIVFGRKKSLPRKKKGNQIEQEKKEEEEEEIEEQDKQYWESLRRIYRQYCTLRSSDHADSVDWEAVRCADVNKVAKAIEGRGQHNVIAQRIQALLNKLVEMHGSIDLEWLRYAPPDKVKEYLLKVYGLGLKSVECIRLLALEQIAFPVDVNVGRIAVRLGWVPLEPLPGSIEFHLLDQYPIIDMVQQYLWPRLCTIAQPKLYQLHYHLITFGKVFCTKKQPNCNACPMRGECKHFASASASPTFALPDNNAGERPNNSTVKSNLPVKCLEGFNDPLVVCNVSDTSTTNIKQCEPIVDYPASPSPKNTMSEIVEDIEDFCKSNDDSEEVITINLNGERLEAYQNYFELNDMEDSNVVVPYNPNRASKLMPKMRSVSRLRTERMVYVLPDTHPLLAEFPMREVDDPSNYLFVIWSPEELEPCEATQNQGSCSDNNCFSCNYIKEENNQMVPGTILVPCRTARNGRFPLNGTYFQVNEVFADADSSQHPILVPRNWLGTLPTRIAYFGTSTSTILRGLPLEEIQECFWRGYVCVRAIDRTTGAPKPLPYRFHCKTADQLRIKKKRHRNNQDLTAGEVLPMKD